MAGVLRRFGLCLGLLALGVGCANPPRIVRRTPVLRWIYRPIPPPLSAREKRFSCELSHKWRGPERLPDGLRFSEARGRANISIAFHPQGSPEWKTPAAYRQQLREEGTVEDSHILQAVEISSVTGHAARFTTYHYDKEYLLGAKVDVLYTELLILPARDGTYVVRYEAKKEDFQEFLKTYEDFLRSLVLMDPQDKDRDLRSGPI